jgi:hypothetical protein
MDDVLPIECVVLVKWLVRSKAVGIDSQRLLLVVLEQESNRRFLGGFRWVNVRRSTAAVSKNEYRRLILVIRSTAEGGQATRARPTVALAALLPGADVQFVDLDRAVELWPRRVQRPQEVLDAPIHCLVGDSEFSVKLPNARVQPDVGVDGEIPLSERYRRVFEDGVSLVVERLAAILTQIPLKHSIAAVPNP